MDRVKKIQLIQRSLGLRHKLKVHDSMKPAETHEDLAVMLLARWELEDELRAIEELIAENRAKNVALKRTNFLKKDSVSPADELGEPAPAPQKKKPK